MSLGKISAAVAVALALSSTPVLAAGQAVRASSSSLSVQSVGVSKASARKATMLKQANAAASSGIIMGVVALGLAVTAVVVASDGNDGPTSP